MSERPGEPGDAAGGDAPSVAVGGGEGERPSDRPIVDRPDHGEEDVPRTDAGDVDGSDTEAPDTEDRGDAAVESEPPSPEERGSERGSGATSPARTTAPGGEVPATTTTGDPAADVRTSPHAGATTRAERGDDLDDADQLHDDGRHLQRPDPDRPDPDRPDHGEGR